MFSGSYVKLSPENPIANNEAHRQSSALANARENSFGGFAFFSSCGNFMILNLFMLLFLSATKADPCYADLSNKGAN